MRARDPVWAALVPYTVRLAPRYDPLGRLLGWWISERLQDVSGVWWIGGWQWFVAN